MLDSGTAAAGKGLRFAREKERERVREVGMRVSRDTPADHDEAGVRVIRDQQPHPASLDTGRWTRNYGTTQRKESSSAQRVAHDDSASRT